MKSTRLAIERAEANMEDSTRTHLVDSGWTYTTATASTFFGLYEKQLSDGRVAIANATTALHIQDYLDAADEDALTWPPKNAKPNDAFRWICPRCSTVNGIDTLVCLSGCGTARTESCVIVPAMEEVRMLMHANSDGTVAEADFKGTAVKAWVAIAVDWFRSVGGRSYVVMDMTDGRDGEQYTFTVQRKNGTALPLNAIEKAQLIDRLMDVFRKLDDFYDMKEAIQWINSPQQPLGGRIPGDLLLTATGTKEVSAVLAQLADGAFT